MDGEEARNISKFISKYRLLFGLLGTLAFIGIVAGSLWYAFTGVGRRTQGDLTVPGGDASAGTASSTGMVARHLDGVMVASGTEALPAFAIAIDGHAEARPTAGLARANLVFDVPVEGGITRYLAVYDASTTADQIGPVRSARPYCVELVEGLGAVYGHVGGSPEALEDIKKMPSFRDLNEYSNGQYYWRSTDRSAPHNAYTRMDQLNEAFAAKKWSVGSITPWQYKDDDTEDGAASTTPRGTSDGPSLAYGADYAVSWSYDRPNDQYTRHVGGKKQRDADGSYIIAKNIVVVAMPATVIDDKGRLNMPTTGRGKARLFRDGHVSDAVWRRHPGEGLTFESIDGADLFFDRGITWLEIVGDASVLDLNATSTKPS